MSKQLKLKLMCLGSGLLFTFIFFDNWHMAMTEGRYYVQSSVVMPAGAIMSFILLLVPFPQSIVDNSKTKKRSAIFLGLLFLSLSIGFLNYYLISHYRPSSRSPEFWPELGRVWRNAPDMILQLFHH